MDVAVWREDERSEGVERIRQRLLSSLDATPRLGPAVVAGVGTGLFLVSFLNFFREVALLGFGWPQVAAVVLGAWLSSLVVYGAIYLGRSDLPARQRWKVAGFTLGGVVFEYVVMYLAIAVRISAGVEVGRPTIQLLASADTGALAGLVIGLLFVRARQDAREARRVGEQLEFLHGVLRHDVRNSMTVVRGRADHLDTQLNGDHEESLDAIRNQTESVVELSRRARAMVDAVAEDADVEPSPVPLSDVLRTEIGTIDATYEDVRVVSRVPDGVTVLADEMLPEVVGNVLGNAVKHNDADDPVVFVDVRVAPGSVVVRIADNGPGVPDAEKEAVFERGHSSQGGGFGLFFVRTMVRQYGGDVRIDDRAEHNLPGLRGDGDRGTVVVIDLPRPDTDSGQFSAEKFGA